MLGMSQSYYTEDSPGSLKVGMTTMKFCHWILSPFLASENRRPFPALLLIFPYIYMRFVQAHWRENGIIFLREENRQS